MKKVLAWLAGQKSPLAGIAMGLAGVGLVVLGNPRNSGICVSCFVESVAGSLRLHDDPRMTYLRPELMGFLLGSTATALLFRNFRVRGGSATLLRFLVGMLLIVGSAVFLGCPIKAVLRLAAGDLTAVSGLLGLTAGVWLGVLFLRKGFFLGKDLATRPLTGWMVPGLMMVLAVAVFWGPPGFRGGMVGSAAEHAPTLVSFTLGALVGGLAQRSKFCVTGGLRNFFLTGELAMISGVGLLLVSAFAFNLSQGFFLPGLQDQPGSHLDYGWSAAGMFLVGFGSILIGGCPFRQLILAGEGDADAGAAVLGMLIGGGLVYSWGIRSTLAGATPAGKAATALGLLILLVIGVAFREKS